MGGGAGVVVRGRKVIVLMPLVALDRFLIDKTWHGVVLTATVLTIPKHKMNTHSVIPTI